MPEPRAVVMAREFKAQLLLREQAQMRQMASAWLSVERALEAQIAALGYQIQADEITSGSRVLQLERTRILLAQANAEVNRYAAGAERTIAEQQRQLAALGIQNAAALTRAASGGLGAFFDILPVDAVEALAGRASNGAPLASLLKQAWPDAAQGITDGLLKAVALGLNPAETARLLNNGLALGLNRTLVIARTEQLGAYRDAARMQYEQSGVVSGYKRLAAHDSRTCAGCLLSEGRFYRNQDDMQEHPQGRCASVPVVRGQPPLQWTGGAAWLKQQDPQMQAQILGPETYNAWRSGKLALGDLVKTVPSASWGSSIVQRPLKEMIRA